MRESTLKHIGESRLINCGQVCTVIGWYKGKPVLKFEDGTTVEDKRYEDFIKGSIMNPKLMDLTGYRFGISKFWNMQDIQTNTEIRCGTASTPAGLSLIFQERRYWEDVTVRSTVDVKIPHLHNTTNLSRFC